MNGKKAKILRRMAKFEMAGDPDRDLVAAPKSRTTAFNSPNSVRGMHLQLKKVYARKKKSGELQ